MCPPPQRELEVEWWWRGSFVNLRPWSWCSAYWVIPHAIMAFHQLYVQWNGKGYFFLSQVQVHDRRLHSSRNNIARDLSTSVKWAKLQPEIGRKTRHPEDKTRPKPVFTYLEMRRCELWRSTSWWLVRVVHVRFKDKKSCLTHIIIS